MSTRKFKAATISKLTNDWAYSTLQINEDIRNSLEIMRSRSRDMAKNNNHYRKYLSMRDRNIIGPNGFTLQMRVVDFGGNPDKMANDIIEREWDLWGRKNNCSVSRRQSWYDILRLVNQTIAVDGETIVRIVRGFDNPHSFALQVIDAAALDVTRNSTLPDGNTIIQGVEFNSWGSPVAYHFTADSYRNTLNAYGKNKNAYTVRIPATDIIHIFKPDFPDQARGYPKACASMLAMNVLQGYSEAELIAARVSACKMGFYTQDAGKDQIALADDVEKDGNQVTALISEAEPGKFEILPKGFDFKSYSPDHPNSNYDAFAKSQLREIAAGLDVAYNTLASDLESVNYSSMRGGTIEERDAWMMEQRFFIESFVTPVFEAWLDILLLSGKTPLPYSKYNKFNQPEFIGRRWQWVDPRADAAANIQLMDKGLKTPQEILAEQGKDLTDVYQQISAAQDLAKSFNLNIFPQAQGVPANENQTV